MPEKQVENSRMKILDSTYRVPLFFLKKSINHELGAGTTCSVVD
jgi:hypothetical protein